MAATETQGRPTHNAVKLVGEVFVPGASLLMDGKILAGGAHLLAGALARVWFGPIGLAVVIANSYASSTTGKGLLKQFTANGSKPTEPTTTTVTPVATSPATPVTAMP